MAVSYKKLWKILIDRDMNKSQLKTIAGLSSSCMMKLSKNESIDPESINKIRKTKKQ